MTKSPWSVDRLRDARLEYVKQQIVQKPKIEYLAMVGNSDGGASMARKQKQFPTVVAIDATFTHHTGEKIYGIYWYRDYAKRCYTLAQRLVLSTLVTPNKLVPLSWKLYHRGFLDEQKNYLKEMAPEPDSFAHSLPKDVFKPVIVETRHGEPRTYYGFSKAVQVRGWKS